MAASFNPHFEDDDDEIPEIDLTITVRPYMYEPTNRNLSESSTESESEDEIGSSSSDSENGDAIGMLDQWCTCGHCCVMPTVQECKCCTSISAVNEKIEDDGLQCITEHEGFIGNCLNRHVIEASFYEYIQDHGQLDADQLVHEIYRYIAYRRFARWIWKILGKKNRRVLPSCAVTKIRQQFPSQQYCGFRYPS